MQCGKYAFIALKLINRSRGPQGYGSDAVLMIEAYLSRDYLENYLYNTPKIYDHHKDSILNLCQTWIFKENFIAKGPKSAFLDYIFWAAGYIGRCNHTKTLSVLSLDYVFFETSSTTPYQIRRIEELSKVSRHFIYQIPSRTTQVFFENFLGAPIREGGTDGERIPKLRSADYVEMPWVTWCHIDFVSIVDPKWQCGGKSYVFLSEEGHLKFPYAPCGQTSK